MFTCQLEEKKHPTYLSLEFDNTTADTVEMKTVDIQKDEIFKKCRIRNFFGWVDTSSALGSRVARGFQEGKVYHWWPKASISVFLAVM